MDYGKTLHLPETEFPMRGNLPKREPEILKFWEDNKIYQKRLELRKDAKPLFCMMALHMRTVNCTSVMPSTKR